jgi:exocyst complex component 4
MPADFGFRFVFVGLGHLLESILIPNARYLRHVNLAGVKKILRNILALQQRIRTIADEKQSMQLERAKRYYSLFFMSPTVSSFR